MNTLADRVRAAAEATAQEIKPDSIRDWRDLAIHSTSGRERDALTRQWRVRARWLAPVTAAVAVLAVIVASAVLGADHAGSPSRSHEPAAAGSGARPRYYALLLSVSLPTGPPARPAGGRGDQPQPGRQTWRLVIHDALTGAPLATARLPGQYASYMIGAAGSDTTFVLGQQSSTGQTSFLLARFDRASKTITVRSLPIAPLPSGTGANLIALSPDGTELAVAAQTNFSHTPSHNEIRLYSLTTGAVRVWTASTPWWASLQGLYWGPAGVLAFDLISIGNAAVATAGIRLLNTNAAAGSLLAASTLAVSQNQPAGYVVAGPFALIDKGTAVVTVVGPEDVHYGKVDSQFEVLSTRTGRVIRAFLPSKVPGDNDSLVWASPSGAVIAGYVRYAGREPKLLGPLEWISATGYTPIKGVSTEMPSIAF